MGYSWASAVVLIPPAPAAAVEGPDLAPGDQIVALSPSGACVGTSTWDGTGAALPLWADDPATAELDGLEEGDPVSFVVYPAGREGQAVAVAFTFQAAFAPSEGFVPDEVYVVRSDAASAPGDLAQGTLGPVRPNPAVHAAQIPLALAADAEVHAEVFDALGRHVATLFRGRLEAGGHVFPIDASALASGTYVCQVRADGDLFHRSFTVAR